MAPLHIYNTKPYSPLWATVAIVSAIPAVFVWKTIWNGWVQSKIDNWDEFTDRTIGRIFLNYSPQIGPAEVPVSAALKIAPQKIFSELKAFDKSQEAVPPLMMR